MALNKDCEFRGAARIANIEKFNNRCKSVCLVTMLVPVLVPINRNLFWNLIKRSRYLLLFIIYRIPYLYICCCLLLLFVFT